MKNKDKFVEYVFNDLINNVELVNDFRTNLVGVRFPSFPYQDDRDLRGSHPLNYFKYGRSFVLTTVPSLKEEYPFVRDSDYNFYKYLQSRYGITMDILPQLIVKLKKWNPLEHSDTINESISDKTQKYYEYIADDVLNKSYTESDGSDIIVPTLTGNGRFNLPRLLDQSAFFGMYKTYFYNYVTNTYGARDNDLPLIWDIFKIKAIKRFWNG